MTNGQGGVLAIGDDASNTTAPRISLAHLPTRKEKAVEPDLLGQVEANQGW